MFRRIAILSLVVAASTVTSSQDASAGCYAPRIYHGHHHVNYVNYVRPYHHVHRPQLQIAVPGFAAEPEFPSVPTGATLTIPGNFLGEIPGSVFMVFNNIKLPVQINQWSMTGVTVTLPSIAIRDAVLVRLDIVLPDGRLGDSQKLYVTAAAPVVLHPTNPTSPLPTNAALSAQSADLIGSFE